MVKAKVIAGNGGQVIGLARMRMGIVPREEDAMALQITNVLVFGDVGIILGDGPRLAVHDRPQLNGPKEMYVQYVPDFQARW